MSTNELESKVRELRQLQQLIEEATAEAEDIKDQSPHGRGRGATGRGVQNHLEVRNFHQNGHSGPQSGLAGGGGQIYQDHDHTPLLCSIKRAPISQPTKARGYRSRTQTTRGPVKSL